MKNECSNLIGNKHLRVGLEFDGRSLRVTSMWEVDQPVVQLDRFSKGLLVRVDVPGLPSFLEALDDPRTVRGIYREKHGHAFLTEESGVIYVSVPFTRLDSLRNIRIRITDIADLDLGPRERSRMAAVFDEPPSKLRQVFELGTDILRAHPDWGKIRGTPGGAEPEARFELCREKDGGYRWRMVRFPGDEIACSARSYRSHEACLADLRWVRNHACDAPVIPMDLRGGSDKSGKPNASDNPAPPGKRGEDDEECDNAEQ